jgi:polysaccharide export outer membrane protein
MGLIKQLESTEMVGRLAVNMIQIEAGNPEYDFVLEQGDKLMVPRKTRSVTVIGEVQYPSSHSYDGNLSVKDYLALAGNPRKRADEDRVYVIRADGSVLMSSGGLFSSNAEITPGDTIVVPLDVEYKDSLSLWGQVTQIAYQAAIAVAAVKSL